MRSRKASLLLAALVVVGVVALISVYLVNQGPRKQAIAKLEELEQVIREGNSARLLEIVVLPTVVRDRAPVERDRLLREILKGEVTPEGIEILEREGKWGHLVEVFPEEAARWTEPIGIDPAECVAFRRDGGQFRAEVVLHRDGRGLRIIRCNDVR